MAVIEIKVPAIAESVTEVTLSQWLKADGSIVKIDEPLCEFESDKAYFVVQGPDGNATVEGTASGFPDIEVCQYGGADGPKGINIPHQGGSDGITGPLNLLNTRSVSGTLQ